MDERKESAIQAVLDSFANYVKLEGDGHYRNEPRQTESHIEYMKLPYTSLLPHVPLKPPSLLFDLLGNKSHSPLIPLRLLSRYTLHLIL